MAEEGDSADGERSDADSEDSNSAPEMALRLTLVFVAALVLIQGFEFYVDAVEGGTLPPESALVLIVGLVVVMVVYKYI